ncbi:GNAT family N-acetyltransferase [uncultured Tateyamaria sp.]|uniref:GNAT family N-acetyltransferase n=1 Tax=uncultured Tateyamaria sp. TaxID=455651 RepID=UPI00261D195B|nr:GNAT family N-acetyltransferase [uncultured Tateyamaria sp.]
MEIRSATSDDAESISDVLKELVTAMKRTKPSDPDFARHHYIDHPDQIRCSIAVDEDGTILGFQSLKTADEGNPYGTPVGWGIIGTHVRPSAARRGVGKELFHSTHDAARRAGIRKIEAFIGEGNGAAIAYYEAIGFRTCRTADGAVCKSFEIG